MRVGGGRRCVRMLATLCPCFSSIYFLTVFCPSLFYNTLCFSMRDIFYLRCMPMSDVGVLICMLLGVRGVIYLIDWGLLVVGGGSWEGERR